MGKQLYQLTKEYNNLDQKEKMLVNEVIRFCENEKRFPEEKELTKKNGYLARTQFYKYFQEDNLKQLYDYILPVYDFSDETDSHKLRVFSKNFEAIYIKPKKIKCIKCGEVKDFTELSFAKHNTQKFGLKYICKNCETKESYERNLLKLCNKNNISDQDKNNIYSWYKAFLKNNLKQMPEFCYEENNIIHIIRYIINDKLNLHTKEEICSINRVQFETYRIDMSIYRLGGKLLAFQKCFPELDITDNDVFPELYTGEVMNDIIHQWINDNKLTINDLLAKGITNKFSNKIDAMIARKFNSRVDMIMWYCNKNNILHPIYNRLINMWDFDEVPHGFWEIKQNRINKIKHYCEQECDESILIYINNTDKLKEWVYKYFRSALISKMFAYSKYNVSLYELLVEVYPIIKDNKILFDWEWHQFNKSDKQTLIKMLRELIIYRLNEYIKNPIKDIPHFINRTFIKSLYPKFLNRFNKSKFNSFYEWCSASFPEYASNWKPEDFGLCIAFDGVQCNSTDEKVLYEFMKIEKGFNYIESIGSNRKGKHVFILPDEYKDNMYCPDFVIEYIKINGKKIKLVKPIYIEYYGMYTEIYNTKVMVKYREKTWRKNDYFKSLNSITFIDVYPSDLKNNFEGFINKLNNILQQLKECT